MDMQKLAVLVVPSEELSVTSCEPEEEAAVPQKADLEDLPVYEKALVNLCLHFAEPPDLETYSA